jgi:hypothetical protein
MLEALPFDAPPAHMPHTPSPGAYEQSGPPSSFPFFPVEQTLAQEEEAVPEHYSEQPLTLQGVLILLVLANTQDSRVGVL